MPVNTNFLTSIVEGFTAVKTRWEIQWRRPRIWRFFGTTIKSVSYHIYIGPHQNLKKDLMLTEWFLFAPSANDPHTILGSSFHSIKRKANRLKKERRKIPSLCWNPKRTLHRKAPLKLCISTLIFTLKIRVWRAWPLQSRAKGNDNQLEEKVRIRQKTRSGYRRIERKGRNLKQQAKEEGQRHTYSPKVIMAVRSSSGLRCSGGIFPFYFALKCFDLVFWLVNFCCWLWYRKRVRS